MWGETYKANVHFLQNVLQNAQTAAFNENWRERKKTRQSYDYRVSLVRLEEFESPTFWSVARRSIQLS